MRNSPNRKNRGQLRSLIVELLRCIAQINTLPPESRKKQDIITFKDKRLGYVVYHTVMEIGSLEDTWIVVDRDEPLWDAVVAQLSDLNPKVYSVGQINKMLIDFVWKFQSKGWQLSGILQEAETLMNSVKDADVFIRRAFFPIWGLVVNVSPFVVGDVNFISRAEHKKIDEILSKRESARNEPKIESLAFTKATGGDNYMIVQNGEDKVNRALNILRAFLYPIVPRAALKQMGIKGSFYSLFKDYFVEDAYNSKGKFYSIPKLVYSRHELSGTDNMVIDPYVKEMALDKNGFNKLNEFLTSSNASQLQKSLLRGADWLGEATKPDTLESKFIKIALAIDSMIGEESDIIPDKGMKARIAERSAFLLADEGKKREGIYVEIDGFIKKRGSLVHGRTVAVSQWETERFGTYVSVILKRLLLGTPAFNSIKGLDTWVRRMSFRG
jgi:hypothetical protein